MIDARAVAGISKMRFWRTKLISNLINSIFYTNRVDLNVNFTDMNYFYKRESEPRRGRWDLKLWSWEMRATFVFCCPIHPARRNIIELELFSLHWSFRKQRTDKRLLDEGIKNESNKLSRNDVFMERKAMTKAKNRDMKSWQEAFNCKPKLS